MTIEQFRGCLKAAFKGAEFMVYGHRVHVLPERHSRVTYDALSQLVREIDQHGGGSPRVDIETAPGEFGGSEVTPADSDRLAFVIWMELTL